MVDEGKVDFRYELAAGCTLDTVVRPEDDGLLFGVVFIGMCFGVADCVLRREGLRAGMLACK